MALLTDAQTAALPELYAQEGEEDPIVHVVLMGANGWVWALTEYSDRAPDDTPENPSRRLAFGWTFGDFDEAGYVSLDEIDELNAGCLPGHGYVWNAPVTPQRLSELTAKMGEIRRELRRQLEEGERAVVKYAEVEV